MYRQRLQSARLSVLLLDLVDDLFSYPVVTIAQAAERLKITQRSAALNIQKLVDEGILHETTGKQRNRVFVAPEIIHIVEASQA